MSDLLHVLPALDTRPWSHLLPSLDNARVTTSDLLLLDATEVGRRAQLSAADISTLVDAVVAALHAHLGFGGEEARPHGISSASGNAHAPEERSSGCISTLDTDLDAALGGGLHSGYLVEVTGESGAGKTQLLLTLLLAAQLPPPLGLSKSAVYISTEAPLPTNRLAQLLSTHPSLASLGSAEKPSLSRILSIQTPDLETQEHILRYQLPVAIHKHGVGLVIVDSVAANYRAEFAKTGARNGAAAMAKRGGQLVQLGALLRQLARTEGIAVVVANQVADRFTHLPPASTSGSVSRTTSANSQSGDRAASNSQHAVQPTAAAPTSYSTGQVFGIALISPDPLALDHQQRWFTGWGDTRTDSSQSQKTPSLGLVWTNQLACRIALIKQPVYSTRRHVIALGGQDEIDDEESHVVRWRRWFKVVFAPWTAPSEGRGIEFEVLRTGIRHVSEKK